MPATQLIEVIAINKLREGVVLTDVEVAVLRALALMIKEACPDPEERIVYSSEDLDEYEFI